MLASQAGFQPRQYSQSRCKNGSVKAIKTDPDFAQKGDYFEFYAEIDLLCALSACPHGDMSKPIWGEDAVDPLDICRPIGVEIYQTR